MQGVPSVPRALEKSVASQGKYEAAYEQLPLAFEINEGQSDPQVKFQCRGAGYGLFLTGSDTVLALNRAEPRKEHSAAKGIKGVKGVAATQKTSDVLRFKLLGAKADPQIEGTEPLPGKSNYFIGNDPKKWRTNVPQYARVKSAQVYPGIDLVYYGRQRQLEYDFQVAPGADPGAIRFTVEGARKLSLDRQDDLVLEMPGGNVIERAPLIYQEVDGRRETICGGYEVRPLAKADSKTAESFAVSFRVAHYDRAKPLVIDPALAYSTYLGGGGGSMMGDAGEGIAVDGSGNIYVAGWTESTNFPITAGAYEGLLSGTSSNAFVTKLNPKLTGSASLVYSTYLGGNGALDPSLGDQAWAIAVDGSGNVYVTGYTTSTNFPTTAGAFQTTPGNSYGTAFVTKLNPNLSGSASLVYSTYLGDSIEDIGGGIAVDGSGNVYVSVAQASTDFPTTAGAFQTTGGGGFLAKLNPKLTGSASLVYSTYLGGNGGAIAYSIAVDGSGNAYVTGATFSTGFPITAGAYQTTYRNTAFGSNAFVMELNPNLSGSASLIYSTYLGGSGAPLDDGLADSGFSIAVDSSGNACITGETSSPDFPTTTSAYQVSLGGTNGHIFMAKLNPNLSGSASLVYSTYLGGNDDDVGSGTGERGFGVAVDGSGNAYVTGYTYAPNFPTTPDAYENSLNGTTEAVFVTKLNPALSGSASLVYSTYLDHAASGQGIAVDGSGNAYVTGYAGSDFPTTAGAYQASLAGTNGNAFVACISIGSGTISQTYMVTGTAGANGGISPDTQDVVSSGSSIVFTATPATGYGVYEWLLNGNVVQTGDNTYTLNNITGNDSVYVTFTPQGLAPIVTLFNTGVSTNNADGTPATLTADEAPDLNYSITAGVDGAITPFVTDESGYPFPQWTSDTATSKWISPQASYAGIGEDPVGTYTYRTTFDLTGFDLSTVSISGSLAVDNAITAVRINGFDIGYSQNTSNFNFVPISIPSGHYVSGTNTLELDVYNGYSSDGDPSGLQMALSGVGMTGTAAPVTYTVTPISGSNGEISPGTAQTVVSGSYITFTATADPGYGVDQWLVNGSTVQTGGTSYTLLHVSGSDTVEVTFEQTPAITSTLAASGSAGQFFSYHITATNQPWSYGATGSLDGLAVDPVTGIISGFPASSGTFPVGLSASNLSGTGTAGLVLTIAQPPPQIIGGWYGTGIVGQAFSDQIVATNSPTLYTPSGSLPPGLSLDPSAGLLSGTPTVSGSFQVPVSASNSSGTASAVLNVLITDSNGFHEIDLSPYGNFPIQDAITTVPAPPVGNVTLGGVPFLISPIAPQGNNIWSAATAEPGIGEATLTVPVNLPNVSEVHLLMNTFWGQPSVLAHINLVFDSGTYSQNLLGNSDIRDYQNWVFTNLVNGITSVPVFSGSSTYDHVAGRIDKMVIAVPAQYQGANLMEVQAVDDGAVDVQRLLVMGLTVRVGSASLPLSVKSTPSSAGSVTTSSTSAALSRRGALSSAIATLHKETPVGDVSNGQTVTVEAQAKRGWHFVEWLVSGTAISTSPDYQFIPEAEESLTAKFERGTGYPLVVSSSTGGSITRLPDAGSYLKNTKVLLTATADPGYRFAGWAGSVNSTTNPLKVKVTGSMAVTAEFMQSSYEVQTAANPVAGGTASGGGSVQGGAGVTVTAAAAQGYNFMNWTENGQVVSTGTSYYFEAGRSRNLVANFGQGQGVAINIPDTTGGQVTLSPAQADYAPGTQVTLSAYAATGYEFQYWSGDIRSTANPLTITTGTTDIAVAPQFVPAVARAVLLAGTSAQTLIANCYYGGAAPGHNMTVSLKPGRTQSLFVYLQNAGASPADFTMNLAGFKKPWTIKVDRVSATKFGTPTYRLGAGEGILFTVTVSASDALRKGSSAQATINAYPTADPSEGDTANFDLSWK